MIHAISSVDAVTGLFQSSSVSPVGVTSSTLTRPAGGVSSPDDFSAMLTSMTSGAISTIKTGEAASIAGVQGQLSAQKVVNAVLAAESTLQTVVAVRDKVVQSYQELSRMAI